MRAQLPKTLFDIMEENERVCLLLADIGEYAFKDIFSQFPDRIYNLGISEQAIVSLASGMAMKGMIPVVYTIAPFLVERAYEQIKVDIGYQDLKVILIGVGASYDYSTMGATHHCPGDVGAIYNIPGINILVPGSGGELDSLLRQAIEQPNASYIRLSQKTNGDAYRVQIGEAIINWGERMPMLIAVGPTLDKVYEIAARLDVGLIYCTSIRPLKMEAIFERQPKQIVIVEPYYPTLALAISEYPGCNCPVSSVGIERQFIHEYGKTYELDKLVGMDEVGLYRRVSEVLRK